jgi:hypothetical protein
MDFNDGGIGIHLPVAVTVRQYFGPDVKSLLLSIPLSFTFDSPCLSSVSPTNGPPTAKSQPVGMIGSGFSPLDYSIKARLGDTACERSQWIADSIILCKHSAAVSQKLSVVCSLLRTEFSTSQVYSYDQAVLSDVAPVNAPPKGSDTLTLFGKGFGTLDTTQAARLHHVAPPLGELTCLSTLWTSDSTATCLLPAALDTDVHVAITTNRLVFTLFSIFSYDGPAMYAIKPTNVPSTGALFTVTGRNFGSADKMGVRLVRLGNASIQDTSSLSPHALVAQGIIHWQFKASDTSMGARFVRLGNA